MSSNTINNFRGKYFFLSNFYEAFIVYNGCSFTNNEAAFQSQKCPSQMKSFENLDPSSAKRKGRHVALRPDWENVKIGIMRDIVERKFTQNPQLRVKLLSTENAHLEEGNNWGDKIWGTVDGVGQNHLGKILMKVREQMRVIAVNELVVLERENGLYGGYVIDNDRYNQVFNTDKTMLFFSIKHYTDRRYTVVCLDKSDEKLFMKNRKALEAAVNQITTK